MGCILEAQHVLGCILEAHHILLIMSWKLNTKRWKSHVNMSCKLNLSAFLQGVSPARPQLLREGRGSALIRSNDSLCFPRGHDVDHWEGDLHLASASVPPHGRACAPGWQGSGVL
jgi:hypothetical protein